jgi:hypothetical protein
VFERLDAVTAKESTCLQAYRRLAQDIADPMTGVILGLLERETNEDRSLLRRIAAGALDALSAPASARCGSEHELAQLEALSRSARACAAELRDIECQERDAGDNTICLLLDALANDSDRHAHLLDLLAARCRAESHPTG